MASRGFGLDEDLHPTQREASAQSHRLATQTIGSQGAAVHARRFRGDPGLHGADAR